MSDFYKDMICGAKIVLPCVFIAVICSIKWGSAAFVVVFGLFMTGMICGLLGMLIRSGESE